MNARETNEPDRLQALHELHGMGLLSAAELEEELAKLPAEGSKEPDRRRRWFLRQLGIA